jgi:CBS domain-containing protein
MQTAEDILREKNREPIATSPDSSIGEALRLMTRNGIGAILVKDGEALVGIWTERDLTRNVLTPGFDPEKALLRDYMVSKLVFTPHTDTVYELMDKILGRRHRHLLIEREGGFIGLLTSGDVMKAFMQTKQKELQGLNEIIGWEYYEEWRWTRESGKTDNSNPSRA